VLIELNKLKL